MLKSEKVSRNFSARLNAAMKARGYTICSLAQTIGVTHSSIYGYLEGKRLPRADYMVAMAEALGVGLDWLVGRKGAAKRGAWLPQDGSLGEMCQCSECGTVFRNFGQDKFCRECGTRMDADSGVK